MTPSDLPDGPMPDNRPFADSQLWLEPQSEASPAADAPKETPADARPEPPAARPTLDGEPAAAEAMEEPPVAGTWEATREHLRQRYPSARDGVLFCLFKLQENPEVSLRDFRDEAKLRGVPVSGRSLHSAKVLLGMAEPATRRSRKAPEPELEQAEESAGQPAAPARRPGRPAAGNPAAGAPSARSSAPRRAATRRSARAGQAAVSSLEGQLTEALQHIQAQAHAEADRLRDAIARAIEVLQTALDESDG